MNQVKIKEEKLTAFVLGELSEVEAAAIEQLLRTDDGLRKEVDDLRSFTRELGRTLQTEPVPASHPATASALRRMASGTNPGSGSQRSRHGSAFSIWKWLGVGVPVLATAAAAVMLIRPALLPQLGDFLPGKGGGRSAGGDAREVQHVPAGSQDPAADQAEKERKKYLAEHTPPPAEQVAAKPKRENKVAPPQVSAPASASGVDLSKLGLGVGKVHPSGIPGSKSSVSALPSGGKGMSLAQEGRGRRVADGSSAGPRKDKRAEAEAPADDEDFNTEAYDHITDNPFILTGVDPRSTFSVDVDTASYANIRRFIGSGQLPPRDAVRIEEMINYFRFEYAKPTGKRPFSVNVEVASAPWNPDHRLVRVGLKGREIDWGKRPASNLVFLLDVSGSMNSPNKLPLLKQAFRMLVDNLGEQDRVAIVVYAGASGLVLPATSAAKKQEILDAIENLEAGGSTNGGAGISLAYQIAARNFIKGGINRVILATDGDFNVGTTSQGDLIRLVQDKAKSGIFLSVLGFGMGNIKDATLEKIADKGNGHYAYIDTTGEARKVLVEEVGGTLMTIAKDVKLQVEFNPARVQAYRLIGYENRLLAHADFNDDSKDAGDIGAGHVVTAFYEIVPPGVKFSGRNVDGLKYQQPAPSAGAASDELMSLKLRYKEPDAGKSSLIEYAVDDPGRNWQDATDDYKFAAAVAAFGMVLRDSEHKGKTDFELVKTLAGSGLENDHGGLRREFLELVRKAEKLKR